ncbi:hypothetical protein B0T22DRAFT_24329 [Podospora appendiculata]|uniref:Fe2OG dioxygenase domain-containing protein n=1 Tax=Podospora appendiculata TaxID=314037 RepID=A0AAE1CFU5_9PEZI|nr:hypothetical protein B0T22DRAFT_24329 [Podospora appendiculata]
MEPHPSSSQIQPPRFLEESRITAVSPSAYYIADFISEEEEKLILEKLTHRRLQTWPSDMVRGDTLLGAGPLPEWLEQLIPRMLSMPLSEDEPNIFAASPHGRPNHVLVNEYPPGTGIMPHKDGSAYYPVVCTVSLGSTICLNLHKSKPDGALDPKPVWRILQEPRSLLITTAELYSEYLHGIEAIATDMDICEATIANWTRLRSPLSFKDGCHTRETRVSLTYRDVLKVSKLGGKLGPVFKRS